MISRPCVDHIRAVDLFRQNHAHELMGEGHIRKGKFIVRRLLDFFRKSAGRADDEGDVLPLVGKLLKARCELFAGLLLSLHRQSDDVSFAGAQNILRLRFGIRPFGKLLDLHFDKAGEAFDVLRHPLAVKTFLDFSNDYEIDFLHNLSYQPRYEYAHPHDDAQDDSRECVQQKPLSFRPVFLPVFGLFIQEEAYHGCDETQNFQNE